MKYKVMLADDEPIMRKALQTLIDWNELECEVICVAENGQEVIEKLDEMLPDILITDIKMPAADGIQIAKYIYENKLCTKTIILTAYADFSYAKLAIKYNVVEYVTKTGAFDELLCAIKNCIKQLKEEESKNTIDEKDNFFRAVYDGNIYENIVLQCKKMNIENQKYAVIFFKFLMDEMIERDKKVKIYNSLKNFYKLAFSERLIHGMFYQKNLYGLIVNCDHERKLAVDYLRETCEKVMDMMDNFMELYVYVGISRIHDNLEELAEVYEEARCALNHSGFEESDKINFYWEEMKQEEIPVISMDAKQKLINESLKYIDSNFKKNITVSDVSKAVGTSASYLSRIFKEYTGETIIQTINKKKIEKAKEYLSKTDYRVYEVADALGFENITYFSRFFKKHTGVSPKEYKDNCL